MDKKTWDGLCRSFWQTSHWQEYLQHSKFGVEIINHSFFIGQNIVPLIQEGDELFSPGFSDKKEILQEIRRIALDNGIKRVQVNSDIRSYLKISGYTCILDLENIVPSKGHKSAIKKSKQFITAHEYNTESLLNFAEDYFKVAGKRTRPEKAFKILNSWLGKYGFILTAYCDGKTAGAIYVLHFKDWAYYFMGYTKPEYRHCNVTHYLQSEAFKILRIKGVKRYELGEQVYDSLIHQPTEKERNISLFKRNFGGQIVVSPTSEYFFDLDFMEQTYTERLKNYIKERANE